MKKNKIILIGYMASGKTTYGKLLASELNLEFIDLDNYIEEREKLSVSEIFEQKGEIYFRKQEHLYLKELLEAKMNYVLAVGGGTPCYAGNMDLIKDAAHSIYLQFPLEVLVDRLFIDKDNRPLIAHLEQKTDLEDFLRKHLFERAPYYQQAHQKLLLSHESHDEVVDKLIQLL